MSVSEGRGGGKRSGLSASEVWRREEERALKHVFCLVLFGLIRQYYTHVTD